MVADFICTSYTFLKRIFVDFTQRWIWFDNWTYTADVTPFLSTLEKDPQDTMLLFYGLDTVANIVRKATWRFFDTSDIY